jgi:Lon protease-like protein
MEVSQKPAAKSHNSIMRPDLLPLFPLQVVVFPRTSLPLHIFEERYKDMIGEAIRAHSEFGVVLSKDDGIVNAGCTVRVEEVTKRYDDGRMDVLTRGCRRFEVVGLNEEKAYLQGEVEFFDDDEPGPAALELQEKALVQYRDLLAAGEFQQAPDPVVTDPQLSFQLAQALEDLDFLHLLLRNRSESDRLKRLASYLANHVPKLRHTARMKKLAPLNGHSSMPPGI